MYVSDSTISNLTCEPQPATGSTHSPIPRPGIASSRTMLSPSEIASCRHQPLLCTSPTPAPCHIGQGHSQPLPKHLSQSPQQATLSWISFVPIRVIPGVVWRHGIAAAVGPKVPMRHFHERDASCLQLIQRLTHPVEPSLLLLGLLASRKQTDVRNKVRQFLGRALLHWARRQFAHHAQRPIGDSSAVRFIGHDGFHRSARSHLQRPQPLS